MVHPSIPGIQRCANCRWLFVSPDPLRIRRCADCKQKEDSYEPPKATIAQVDGAVRYHLKENP